MRERPTKPFGIRTGRNTMNAHKWINTEEGHEQCLACGVSQPATIGDNQATCLPSFCPTHEVSRPHYFDLDRPWVGHYITQPGEAGVSTLEDNPLLTVFGGWTIRCVFCEYRITETTKPSTIVWQCVDEEGSL